MLAQFVLYVGAALLVGGLALRHLLTSGFAGPLIPGVPRLRWPLLGLVLLALGAAWKTYGVLAELEMLNVTDTVDFLTRVPAGRSALYLLIGACLLLAAHVSRFSRLTEMGTGALMLWGLAGLGHGATHGDFIRFMHLLHAGAMSVWVAGVGGLLLVRPLPPQALKRFSAMATVCVLLLAVTGVTMSLSHGGSLEKLAGSIYGQRLFTKVGLFVVVLGLAFTVRRAALKGKRSRAMLVEFILLVGILLLTASLVGLAPPSHTY